MHKYHLSIELKKNESMQFLPGGLRENFLSDCGTYAKLLSSLFHDNGFSRQELRGLFDSASTQVANSFSNQY